MQDWPIEVADAARLPDFLALLRNHRMDWELTFWFLDLVLQSGTERDDLETLGNTILDAVVLAVSATRSPHLVERLEYWACLESSLDDAFEIARVARGALDRLR